MENSMTNKMKKKEIIKNAFYLLNEVSDLKHQLELEKLENKKLTNQLYLYDVVRTQLVDMYENGIIKQFKEELNSLDEKQFNCGIDNGIDKCKSQCYACQNLEYLKQQ